MPASTWRAGAHRVEAIGIEFVGHGCALGDAVLAHEQAHLRGRHHLVLAAGRILRRAFPWVPAFRWAYEEVTRLVAAELLHRARSMTTSPRAEELADSVASGDLDPWSAADELLGTDPA